MIIIEFFRDILSGIYYYIYVAFMVLFIFAIIGYIGESKEKEQEENEVMNLGGAAVNNNDAIQQNANVQSQPQNIVQQNTNISNN